MKIIWTELAVEKLEEFADYIALDKPSAALSWVKKKHKSVNKLKDFSESGRKMPEIKRANILATTKHKKLLETELHYTFFRAFYFKENAK